MIKNCRFNTSELLDLVKGVLASLCEALTELAPLIADHDFKELGLQTLEVH